MRPTWKFGRLIAAALAFTASSGFASDYPNIILFMAEDITLDLSCYGHDTVYTPNIDRLAIDGIRYNRFYTTSPQCSTSRTSLMTGIYHTTTGGIHHRSRVSPSSEVKPMTHYLKDQGYITVLGTELIEPNGAKLDINFTGWNANYLFDYVSTLEKALKEHPEKPFFQQITLAKSHRMFQDEWPEFRKKLSHPVEPSAVKMPAYLPDDPLIREDEALRLNSIQYIDRQIGIILSDYEERGLLDDAIVIFIGDNGQHQVRGKSYLYEQGILCPLIIWGKERITRGQVSNDLLSGVDLVATILKMAGIATPEAIQGRSFLFNPDYEPRDYVVTARDRVDEVPDCIRAITNGRFKYIRNFMPEIPYDARMEWYETYRPILPRMRDLHAAGKLNSAQAAFLASSKPNEELYDLRNDPDETVNLIKDEEYAFIRDELREVLSNWIIDSGDRGLKMNSDGRLAPVADWKGEISERFKKPMVKGKETK